MRSKTVIDVQTDFGVNIHTFFIQQLQSPSAQIHHLLIDIQGVFPSCPRSLCPFHTKTQRKSLANATSSTASREIPVLYEGLIRPLLVPIIPNYKPHCQAAGQQITRACVLKMAPTPRRICLYIKWHAVTCKTKIRGGERWTVRHRASSLRV